jgi:hypothetical protein
MCANRDPECKPGTQSLRAIAHRSGRVGGKRGTLRPFSHRPSPNCTCGFPSMQLSRRPSSFRSTDAHYAPRPCVDCLPALLRPVNGATLSDYYEGSVPLDLAIRRGSRLCTHNTLSMLRCPFVLNPGHSWFLAGESLTPAQI